VAWYDKIGKWLKDWWGLIAGAVLFIVGFFVGRGRRSGTHSDIEKLRADNEELREQIRELRGTADRLRQIDGERRDELEELEVHLAEAERAAAILRSELERGGDDIGELGETNRRLGEYVERYGARLREIESVQ